MFILSLYQIAVRNSTAPWGRCATTYVIIPIDSTLVYGCYELEGEALNDSPRIVLKKIIPCFLLEFDHLPPQFDCAFYYASLAGPEIFDHQQTKKYSGPARLIEVNN